MQIKKGNINLKEQIACHSTSVLLEGDIVVSDSCPDIAEILCADAKVRVRETEYKGGKATVTGVIEFCALYVPDGKETELKCAMREFDFSTDIDIKADGDVTLSATATTEHIGFALVNSRKISSKVMVGVKLCAYQEKCYSPVISAEGDDIEKSEKKYNIYIPLSENCTEIIVNDLLQIPEEFPDIAEILKVDSWVTSGDMRIMSGKAMVQGELHLNTLYTASGDGGKVWSVHHSVPFTEIVEAPGADEQTVVNVCYDVEQVIPSIKGDLNGDTKIISVESIICAKVAVSKTVTETVVDDCYFLRCGTQTKYETMKICEYRTSENEKITERYTVDFAKNVNVKELVSCNIKPILKEAKWENGAVKLNGTLVTYIIYRDESDNLGCSVSERELNWEKPSKEACNVEAFWNLNKIDAEVDKNTAQISAQIELGMKALKDKSVKILTDCVEKEDEIKKASPTMVVCFAKEGDSLWDIAKKYRTKTQLIKDANGLETEKLEKGRRLLIPMS